MSSGQVRLFTLIRKFKVDTNVVAVKVLLNVESWRCTVSRNYVCAGVSGYDGHDILGVDCRAAAGRVAAGVFSEPSRSAFGFRV